MQLAPSWNDVDRASTPGALFFMVEVNKLKKADQIRGKVTEFLSPEDFLKLVEMEEVPHYILTNPLTKENIICFLQSDIDDWFQNYVQFRNQKIAPQINFNRNERAKFKICPLNDVPPGLASIRELQQIPFSAFDSPSGIYFLCKGPEIMYIGQAQSVFIRVSTHKREKEFDAVYFIPCHIEQLTPLETALIHFYQPKLNRSTINDVTSADQVILDALNIHKVDQIINCNM